MTLPLYTEPVEDRPAVSPGSSSASFLFLLLLLRSEVDPVREYEVDFSLLEELAASSRASASLLRASLASRSWAIISTSLALLPPSLNDDQSRGEQEPAARTHPEVKAQGGGGRVVVRDHW